MLHELTHKSVHLTPQARLDEESAALAKRQQNYQRDRDQMTQEEEEEYEKAVEESMFRWVRLKLCRYWGTPIWLK